MWYRWTVPNPPPAGVPVRRWPFIVAIAASIGVVVAVEQRGTEAELSAAVERLAAAQHTLARALTMGLERQLAEEGAPQAARAVVRFREDAHRVAPEQLVLVDAGDGLRDAEGALRHAETLEAALRGGADSLVLPREEA